MSRILFTCQWSNDLGLLTRTLPVALELQGRGHEVAFCDPAPVAHELITRAGFTNLEPDVRKLSLPDLEVPPGTAELWDMDHYLWLGGFFDEAIVRTFFEVMLDVVRRYDPDVVVDAVSIHASIAARVLKKPLVTIIQADMHPASRGFIWWREKPPGLPRPAEVINPLLRSYGLEPISSASELVVGDLTLCAGTPETDPLPESAEAVHMGPIFDHQLDAELPAWVDDDAGGEPLVWVYGGNPRYPFAPWANSIAILRAVCEGLGSEDDLRILVTTGHHPWPEELTPPDNLRHVPFLPGVQLGRRSDLMIHHGGHGSCLTGAFVGTPAVIVPTYSERESNARRLAALGVAEMLLPTVDDDGEKRLSAERLREAVRSVLEDPSYAESAGRLARKMRAAQQLDGVNRLERVADHVEELA